MFDILCLDGWFVPNVFTDVLIVHSFNYLLCVFGIMHAFIARNIARNIALLNVQVFCFSLLLFIPVTQ